MCHALRGREDPQAEDTDAEEWRRGPEYTARGGGQEEQEEEEIVLCPPLPICEQCLLYPWQITV